MERFNTHGPLLFFPLPICSPRREANSRYGLPKSVHGLPRSVGLAKDLHNSFRFALVLSWPACRTLEIL